MAGICRSENNLDKWRNYFRTSNSDIFDLIENAIKVSALDFPQEFKSRREKIAEILYSSGTYKCAGCASAELHVSTEEKVEEVRRSEFVGGGNIDGKVDCGSDGQKAEANANKVESSIGYRDYEALIFECEKEDQIVGEVMQIKKILDNSKREADSLVLDSLKRLEEIPMHVDLLKTTKIGKSVNTLRKHASADIRKFSRLLVELWKRLVNDSLVCETEAPKGVLEGTTQDSVNPLAVDEEAGLPTLPLLEDLSFLVAADENVFDGLADYISEQMQQLPADQFFTHPIPIQPTILESESGRSVEPGSENKARLDKKLLHKPKLPSQKAGARTWTKYSYLNSLTRKQGVQIMQPNQSLKERRRGNSRRATNKLRMHARRKRTIQIEDLHDLPKQGRRV